jgi:hypothetical protein
VGRGANLKASILVGYIFTHKSQNTVEAKYLGDNLEAKTKIFSPNASPFLAIA